MADFHHRLEEEIPRLRRYARALTRNAVRADDLVQETLVRALRKEHLWQPGTDLRAWLFTLMHNLNVNEVRRAIRDDATVDLENCSENLTATTDPTVSRQLRELDHALAQLPEEQRQVILLIGLEGMSYEDAATILDVPIGTIRSRLSRGRESLRKLMDMAPSGTSTRRKGFLCVSPTTRAGQNGQAGIGWGGRRRVDVGHRFGADVPASSTFPTWHNRSASRSCCSRARACSRHVHDDHDGDAGPRRRPPGNERPQGSG